MSFALALLASAAARSASACAVCFGKTDNVGLIAGITIGIFVLIGLTFSAMAGIFLAARNIERARAKAEAAAS